jgi:hypothetical protein
MYCRSFFKNFSEIAGLGTVFALSYYIHLCSSFSKQAFITPKRQFSQWFLPQGQFAGIKLFVRKR